MQEGGIVKVNRWSVIFHTCINFASVRVIQVTLTDIWTERVMHTFLSSVSFSPSATRLLRNARQTSNIAGGGLQHPNADIGHWDHLILGIPSCLRLLPSSDQSCLRKAPVLHHRYHCPLLWIIGYYRVSAASCCLYCHIWSRLDWKNERLDAGFRLCWYAGLVEHAVSPYH